jgi:uncharacterized protein (TIGR00730 family)
MATMRSVCVYCGSSNRVAAKHLEAAAAFGRILGQAGIRLIYGGGKVGLMGRVADGVLAAGGQVTGIIPQHLHEKEVAHNGVQDLLVVDSMHERKRLMAEQADGFVILPGGFGTLDEMFEIITWRQLRLHDKPIVMADLDGYWSHLTQLVDRIVDEGFATEANRALFTTVASIDMILPALAREQPPAVPVETKWA